MSDFFKESWYDIVRFYQSYENFIHSFIPNEGGDYAIFIIDGIVIIIILKIIIGLLK